MTRDPKPWLCYLSHRHLASPVAAAEKLKKLFALVSEEQGLLSPVFVDRGHCFAPDNLVDEVRECESLVLILTEGVFEDMWCQAEVYTALQKPWIRVEMLHVQEASFSLAEAYQYLNGLAEETITQEHKLFLEKCNVSVEELKRKLLRLIDETFLPERAPVIEKLSVGAQFVHEKEEYLTSNFQSAQRLFQRLLGPFREIDHSSDSITPQDQAERDGEAGQDQEDLPHVDGIVEHPHRSKSYKEDEAIDRCSEELPHVDEVVEHPHRSKSYKEDEAIDRRSEERSAELDLFEGIISEGDSSSGSDESLLHCHDCISRLCVLFSRRTLFHKGDQYAVREKAA